MRKLIFLLLIPWLLAAQTTKTGRIMTGTLAGRPAACSPGDQYNTTDGNGAFLCNPVNNTWQAFQGASSSILPNTVVAFSATPSFNGTVTAAYSITLTGNVTSSTVTGSPVNGTLMKLHICQGAGGPWTFAFPAGFLNTTTIQTTSCTDETYSFDGTNWSQLTQPAGAGGGGGSSQGPQNTIQAAGSAGAFQVTNLTETGGVLTNGDDNIQRGPNGGGGVDVRFFNGRAVNSNAIPATTGTITGGTNSLVVASASTFQKNDGFALIGAGVVQSMATPGAPTVTPSCASTLTGTGFTVPAGAGSSTYNYEVAMADIGRGYTAASAAGTTTTGNATLGANNMAITSASMSGNVITYLVASTANLATGCLVRVSGTTDDQEFGQWNRITVVDGTHFSMTGNVSSNYAVTSTTATGGTAYFWLCNHIVFPAISAGYFQAIVYGRANGAYAPLYLSYPVNLGYPDASYNTWDDFGSTMSGTTPTMPWWVPATPPASPVNDMLVTTITNISGTTFTLAANAITSVTASSLQFDDVPAITAAASAVATAPGGGGTIRFPASITQGGTFLCFLTSSYLNLTGAVIQDGPVCAGDTIQYNGPIWQGTKNDSPLLTAPSFTLQSSISLNGLGASPVMYLTAGGMSDISLTMKGANAIGIFDTNQSAGHIFDRVNFTGSTGINDAMSIPFYAYKNSASGSFGAKFRNCSFNTGVTQTEGSTSTPLFLSKFDSEVNFDYISGSRRGFAFVLNTQGILGEFNMGEEIQGSMTPLITFIPATSTVVGGTFAIRHTVLDTTADPLFANLSVGPSSMGAAITIEGSNFPSSGFPLITGAQIAGSVFITGMNPQSLLQVGDNLTAIVCGYGPTNLAGACKIPGVNQNVGSGSGNHTLLTNEGGWVSTGTGTVTVDCAKAGQRWAVYSQTGTTTLACNSGTLYGNGSTGSFVIGNSSGVIVDVDNSGNAHATGGGGGGGGGCAPGGITDALQYNGGGTCSFGGVNSPTVNGNYIVNYNVSASAAVPPTINLPGVPINAQVGTSYTYLYTDRAALVTGTNSAAQTYTMVNPATAGFNFNMPYMLWNRGTSSGALTENASGFNVNGGASLLVPINWLSPHWSDGVNWTAARIPEFGAFPNCTGGGNALQFTTATGTFSCGASSAGVSSFTGDGALLSNSASTGAVTATLANAGAHKFWMNNTGSSAAPGYQSPGKSDLLATIVYTDQANTYSTGLQDMSAATFKPPAGAAATAAASTQLILDTTNKNLHAYLNNADAILGGFASAPTTGDCVKATVVSGNVLLADAGAACGSGGGGSALSAITAATGSNTIANGNNPQTWNWAQTTNTQAGMTFGETSAATSGTITGNLANQSEVTISTASASTAVPLNINQGSVTGTASIPILQLQTTWNNASLAGRGLMIQVTDTAHGAGSKLLNIFGGASGTTNEFSVDSAGSAVFNGQLLVGSANGIQATAAATVLTFQGGSDNAASIVGGAIFRGADNNSTSASSSAGGATLRGGDEIGSTGNQESGGAVTIRGGNVTLSTTTASVGGAVNISGGQCASVASSSTCGGQVKVTHSYFSTGTATANDLACVTAANTIASCSATGTGQFVGVIDSSSTNVVNVTGLGTGGTHTFNATSATFTNGHFVCQSTVASSGNLVVDSASACAVGLGIGIYIGATGTQTAPLVWMRPY